MSDQTMREEAARAWFADPDEHTMRALTGAITYNSNYIRPTGELVSWPHAVASWLAWAKADAAKPAPVDALEGAVWVAPNRLIAYVDDPNETRSPSDWRVAASDLATVARFGSLWDPDNPAVAHARAQLAREASAAQASHTTWPLVCATCGTPAVPGRFVCSRCPPLPTEADAVRESAPVAPAMTLDAMREAAKVHGYRLVHESGYEAPAAVLAYIEHALTLSDADGDRYLECFDDIEDGDKPAERAAMAVEAARLRALGVAPAVLS